MSCDPKAGFGTIEALVSMTMLAIASATALSLVTTTSRVFSRETTLASQQNDVASAERIFLEEIMIAGFSPDGVASGPTAFQTVTTSGSLDRVQFVADVDSNGISDRVTYQVTVGVLQRTVEPRSGGAWGAAVTADLLSDVQRFDLSFLDSSRNPVADAQVVAGGVSATSFVRVNLSIGVSVRGQSVSRTRMGEVHFRSS